jgi:soluble lytic murein transglycosylase
VQAPAESPELRQAWLEARRAILETGAELPQRRDLRRYALYPYLEAAAIIARLRSAETYGQGIADAAAFLAAHADSAIADAFHRDLLLTLSELRAWSDFVDFYDQEIANESRECEYLRARVALGLTENLAPLVARRWLTPRRLDSDCEPAFRWLREAGVLDDRLTAQRLELLLESGQTDFARIIAARLPDAMAETYTQWAGMLDRPLESLDAVTAGRLQPRHPDALPMVWARASTRTPMQALARLPAMQTVIEPTSAIGRQMVRDLALGLAWDRKGEALAVFEQLPMAEHDDYALGWLTRSAIWNDEWPLAERALASMSAESREQSDWIYWQARTSVQLGRAEVAVERYTGLLERDNYYSAAAAARLGRRVVPNNQPVATSEAHIEDLAELDGFVRAQELFLIGERVAATREWRYATRNLTADQLVAAMHLASDWGWHDMAVATATRADVFFDYRRLYPLPYAAEIAVAAASQNLDDALLGALIRQESMFRPDAVSSAGAIGLTQLGLSTARGTAQALGLPRPDQDDLFEPAGNTALGAATLRARLVRFDDQLAVALAAYNAGPAAAQRWLPEEARDSDIWIENIPYNETREYVRRVLWNGVVYAWLLTNETPVDTRYLLGSVGSTSAPGR